MTAEKSQSHPLSSIDVLGLGLYVEMFDHSQILGELQQHLDGAIIPADPTAFPMVAREREAASDARAREAVKSAMEAFVKQWPIPSISVWPYCENPKAVKGLPGASHGYPYFDDRINDLRILAGLHQHKVKSLGAFFSDNPEDILERSFQFFDGNVNVPALLILVSDGDQVRSMLGDLTRKAYCGDGPRRYGSMSESFVALLLARRDRVESMRSARPGGGVGFSPTKYLLEPWTDQQIQHFESLPTIARIHRPVRVAHCKDSEGRPTFDTANGSQVMRSKEKQETLKAGMDAVLKCTREGNPARIFYDLGDTSRGRNTISLSNVINSSLPEFDVFDPGMGCDVRLRLGETGAASPFVQWALASIAAFDSKEESVAINARQTGESTVTVITPVIDERKLGKSTATDGELIHLVAAPKVTRAVAIGVRMKSGDECPQMGMWRCDPPDAEAGATHLIRSGRTFPTVSVARTLTAWEKLRGESSFQKVAANWTLESYHSPSEFK